MIHFSETSQLLYCQSIVHVVTYYILYNHIHLSNIHCIKRGLQLTLQQSFGYSRRKKMNPPLSSEVMKLRGGRASLWLVMCDGVLQRYPVFLKFPISVLVRTERIIPELDRVLEVRWTLGQSDSSGLCTQQVMLTQVHRTLLWSSGRVYYQQVTTEPWWCTVQKQRGWARKGFLRWNFIEQRNLQRCGHWNPIIVSTIFASCKRTMETGIYSIPLCTDPQGDGHIIETVQ